MTNGVPNLQLNGKTGFIQALNGKFLGTIGTPFRSVLVSNNQILDLLSGANIMPFTGVSGVDVLVRLPLSQNLNGARCHILNFSLTSIGADTVISIEGGGYFLGCGIERPTSIRINPYTGHIGVFQCVMIGSTVYWVCMNYKELTT